MRTRIQALGLALILGATLAAGATWSVPRTCEADVCFGWKCLSSGSCPGSCACAKVGTDVEGICASVDRAEREG